MFDIISTAKSTQWSSFPTLCTKHSYSHVANESVDFQVIPGKNCFAEFNKKFGFELLRTINKDEKDIIQRIKKRQVDDLSCGSISKIGGSQIAIGKTTGHVRFYSVETADLLPHKFKPDRIGNSVIGLDFSNTDDYLAVVYESADINLFGLKTGIKTDTFRLDKQSTMVRFHPAKQFALAIGSFEGAITMLDIQTKKKLFSEKLAHSAPVRDISMFESAPDVLVSCGYDCYINIFDIRKRSVVLQYQQDHPMSTVCVSPCGTFCVGGNLKGDITSYDIRNMKDPIDTKRAHDSAVVRVAFVPSVVNNAEITPDQTVNCSNFEMTASQAPPTSRQINNRDSFARFVDVCHYNNVATPEDATPKPKRNSWLDLAPAKRCHDFSMDSMAETPSRMSFGAANRSELRLKRLSRMSPDQSMLYKSALAEQTENEVGAKTQTNFEESPTLKTPVTKPRERTVDFQTLRGLRNIQEDLTETDATANRDSQLDNEKSPAPNVCENMGLAKARKRRSTFHESFSLHIKNSNTSSPTGINMHKGNAGSMLEPGAQPAILSGQSLRNMVDRAIDQRMDCHRAMVASRMEASFNEFKDRIDQLTDETSENMKNVLERFYSLGLQGGENLMDRLGEPFKLMENALCSLLERDQYALDYFRMKFEIIELKKKLGIREPKFHEHLQ